MPASSGWKLALPFSFCVRYRWFWGEASGRPQHESEIQIKITGEKHGPRKRILAAEKKRGFGILKVLLSISQR
jgi:hypothetical protein